MDTLLSRVKMLSGMNALEVARTLHGAKEPLLPLLHEAIKTDQPDDLYDALNAAYANVYVRSVLYKGAEGDDLQRWMSKKSIKLGAMTPGLLEWLVDSTWDEYMALQNMGVFIDLEFMETYAHRIGSKENSRTNPDNVSTTPILKKYNVEKWYNMFCTVSPLLDLRIRASIENNYSDLWDVCKKIFEDKTQYDCITVTADYTFCGKPLDILKTYTQGDAKGWRTLLEGSKNSKPFIEELRFMKKALLAASAGKDTIIVSVHSEEFNKDYYRKCSVRDLLSTERLRKLADGYIPYMKRQREIEDAVDVSDITDGYLEFINYFPGPYLTLFDFAMELSCSPEERLETLVPPRLYKTVEKMLPVSWREMTMISLREAVRFALLMCND